MSTKLIQAVFKFSQLPTLELPLIFLRAYVMVQIHLVIVERLSIKSSIPTMRKVFVINIGNSIIHINKLSLTEVGNINISFITKQGSENEEIIEDAKFYEEEGVLENTIPKKSEKNFEQNRDHDDIDEFDTQEPLSKLYNAQKNNTADVKEFTTDSNQVAKSAYKTDLVKHDNSGIKEVLIHSKTNPRLRKRIISKIKKQKEKEGTVCDSCSACIIF
jgi:hypothetical protein